MLKFVPAFAGLNGLRELESLPEDAALPMATTNGYRLWWETDFHGDQVEFTEPLGKYAFAWDDPVPAIAEVYVAGEPRLGRARELIASSGAAAIIRHLRNEVHG